MSDHLNHGLTNRGDQQNDAFFEGFNTDSVVAGIGPERYHLSGHLIARIPPAPATNLRAAEQRSPSQRWPQHR
jgi:hypothetical protein